MRFVTFEREGYDEPGVLVGEEVIGIARCRLRRHDFVIAGGADALDRVHALDRQPPGPRTPGSHPACRLRAPIPRPPKIICMGLNYRDHAEESKLPIPDVPTVFAKYPTAVIGPGPGHRAPQELDQARL